MPNEEGSEIELELSDRYNCCYKCNYASANEPRPCPFKAEIGGDYTSLCNCCSSCRNECAMDV